MQRYDEWLRALPPSRRAELLELPVEKRLERIRQLKHEAARSNFDEFTNRRLRREDMDAIQDWLAEMFQGREAELEKNVPERMRTVASNIEDGKEKVVWLLRVGAVHQHGQVPIDLSEAHINELKKRLSSEARAEIEGLTSAEDRQRHVMGWVRAALFSRRPYPPVNKEELERFYKYELSEGRREELERLPKERFQRELRKAYFREQFRRQFGEGFGARSPFSGRGRGRDFDSERRNRDGEHDREHEQKRERDHDQRHERRGPDESCPEN
jgi:hypothetical protein